MTTTELSSRMSNKVFCCIRKLFVPQTPEEIVRQKVLQLMTQSLDYPQSGFVVEQALHAMPHLHTKPISHFPSRRADILFFSKGIHPSYDLYPLILIECKATKLTEKVINQVTSYNFYIQSYMVAIANHHEIKTGWKNPSGEYHFQNGLPSYTQLKSFFCANLSS
ncbi:hypothetical protein PHSC3_000051 [Chlamydiales bacterium STE3]|nr:hypothetical protein PHSC3_000051 [Chlamydiales bacterium STE3]